MSEKSGSIDFRVLGVVVDQFTAVSDFVTDALDLSGFNDDWVLFCFRELNTTGAPTITVECSSDGVNGWVNYKRDAVLVLLPNSFLDDEFFPRYMRISYVANGSDGTVTLKFDGLKT